MTRNPDTAGRARAFANDDQPEAGQWEEGWDADDVFGTEAEAVDGLRAVARLARLLPEIDWFAAAGQPLTAVDYAEAENYCAGLGFFDVSVGGLATWRQAAEAVSDPEWSSEVWEAEDQAHQALLEIAEQFMPAHDLEVALNHVALRAGELALKQAGAALAQVGLEDEEVLKAAGQAAAQAAHQAALLLAVRALGAVAEEAGLDEAHPFAAKFRLFERGHWPLGLAGNTFSVF